MTFLKAILRVLFSRTTLLILLAAASGCAVWFGGPHLGIGESRPLTSVASRVVLLVFALSFLLFWMLHWPISIVGVTALCLLIWYGSPLLRIGDTAPFEPEGVRLAIVCLLAGIFAVYFLYRLWQAIQANENLLQKMLHPHPNSKDSVAREQLGELREITRQAMLHLRNVTSRVTGLRRLLQGSRFVYELPWYMVLGAPGAGKTTAILNSGLRFPLVERNGAASLEGMSGTRNCVWWFTNEAVLIDTAGRYTTHEISLEVDSAEWKGFLALLRRHRPQAPINGALLTLSVEDLLERDHAGRVQLAALLRERLLELQKELGIRFPVYVIVTKMDRIKGFQEYFQNLNQEGREQVWGFTLPYEGRGARRHTVARDLEQLEGELQLLSGRLQEGLNTRLREEYDEKRRRSLYVFPSEFAGLFEPLLEMAERIFLESRYTSSTIQSLLRGVYFTSAEQSTAPVHAARDTLLDRLRGVVHSGRNWLDNRHDRMRHPEARSYFLHDMLRTVVFPEASLVQPNAHWAWRFLLVRSLGHILVLLVAIGLGGAMLTSRDNNLAMLQGLNARTTQVVDNLDSVFKEKRRNLMPYVLQQACALPYPSGINPAENAFDPESPPWDYRVGLYSLAAPTAEAQAVCERLRERFLLPLAEARLQQQLTKQIQHSTPSNASDELYATLRTYLLFHDTGMDAATRDDTLMEWFQADMKRNPSASFLTENEELIGHLWHVLQRQGLNAAATPPVRTELVDKARDLLHKETQETRLYTRIKQALAAQEPEPFMPSRQVDAQALTLLYRAGGRSMTEGLPGLFTYEGYHTTFRPGLPSLLPEVLRDDAWIMGVPAPSVQAVQSAHRKVQRLYFQEYASIWRQFIGDVRIAVGTLPSTYLAALQMLGGTNSPLEQLGRAVARETALSAADKSVTGQLTDAVEKKVNTKSKGLSDAAFGSIDEIKFVDAPFAAFRKVVTGSTVPDSARAPNILDSQDFAAIRALCNEYAAHMMEVQKAQNGRMLPPPNETADKLQTKAIQLPPFFSTALMDLAHTGSAQEGETRERTLAQLAETQTGIPCRRRLEQRYPFNPRGADADPASIRDILGPDGAFDTFFQQHLAPLVTTESHPWAYTSLTSGALDLTPFEKAAILRERLFPDGEVRNWSLRLSVSVLEMDPRIERLDLTMGEDVLSYEHGPSKTVPILWNAASGKNLVELTVRPRQLGIRPISENGSWALLRLLQRGELEKRGAGVYWLTLDLNGYFVVLELTADDELLSMDWGEALLCPRAGS